MGASEAQKKATIKWQKEKTDEVRFRVPKGEKDIYSAHANEMGEPLAVFLRRAVNEALERDKHQK